MNKNIIITLSIVGLLILGGIGFAIWNNSQVSNQNPTDTTSTDTTPTNSGSDDNTAREVMAPTVVTDSVTAPYISTVVVKGTVVPNGALTTYWYEYGKTSSLGTKTKVYSVGSGYTVLYAPAYITGLSSNTDYYFRLSANNSLGTVNGAVYTFKTNTTPVPTGSAPTTTSMAATDVARTTANLHGKINPNGVQSNFWFEYGLSASLGNVTSFQTSENSNTSSDVSVSLSNLQPLTKYYFRLNAQNQFGTINGEILNFTTKGPVTSKTPIVDTSAATAITSTSAKLNATINPGQATTNYWFEYSDNSLLSNVIALKTPEQALGSGSSQINVSATITGLRSDTKYYVKVVAVNQQGTANGDMVTFTTKK